MNAILLQNLSQPSGIPTKVGQLSKTGDLPVDSHFSLLIGGLLQQATQQVDDQGQAPDMDQVLELLDELLAELFNAIDEEDYSSNLNEETLESEVDQLSTLDSTQLELLLQQLAALFGLENQSTSGSTSVFNLTNSITNLNSFYRLSAFVPYSATSPLEMGMEVLNTMNDESKQVQLKQHIEVLNELRSIIVGAKDGQIQLNKQDLTKIGEMLQQVGQRIPQLTDGNRVVSSEGTKMIPMNTVTPFMFGNGGTTQSTHLSMGMSEQNGSQQGSSANQEQSNSTTKAGFHQMMMSQVGNVPAASEHSSESTVRAQYVQKDLQDVVIRQLQMTRFPNGVQEAKIRLVPENLGSVEVKLVVQNGVVTAQFMAETLAGKELLDSQLAGLRASLLSQGLQVEKLEVNMQQQTNSEQAQDALDRQGGQQREGQREDAQNKNDNEVDFAMLFEEFSEVI